MRGSRLFGSKGGAKLSFVPTPIWHSQRPKTSSIRHYTLQWGEADLVIIRQHRGGQISPPSPRPLLVITRAE